MAHTGSYARQTYKDYSKEKSHIRLPITQITAANYAAQATLQAALFTKLAALTLGQEQDHAVQAYENFVSANAATDAHAQRENKWLLEYVDANGKHFKAELPCADLSLLLTNSDQIDRTTVQWTDLVTAFNAVVVSPDDSSAVTLIDAKFVGRNL